MSRLALNEISKFYGATAALTAGHLSLEPGQIHVLIGANGSGKSTLCKVMAGSVRPDGGSIEFNGKPVSINSPADARALGICLFYQELSLSDTLTVAENICIFDLPTKKSGLVDSEVLANTASQYIELFSSVIGEGFSADTKVGHLRPDQKQLVEIMKTLASEADILIFDEPTSALDRSQVECFFNVLTRLKADGRSVIFISHRMDEIFEIGDRITVMRDGVTVSSELISETDHDEVIRAMIGATPGHTESKSLQSEDKSLSPVCLQVKQLTASKLNKVELSLKEGEILGLGGLHGQGQSRLLRTLFGSETIGSGSVVSYGKTLDLGGPRKAIKNGFAYVSGDRRRDGAITDRSILENVTPVHCFKNKIQLVLMKSIKEVARTALQALNTKYETLGQSINSLSGGNQQKVIISRWLSYPPKILLLDDPSKGVDLGAKTELFELIRKLANQGMAIILYSSEDSELLENSDRILVFNNGEIVRELVGGDKTRFNLYQAAYESS